MSENLVEVRNLCKYFDVGDGRTLKAVDHVSFDIRRGEILGLVGESGCGKTTLGRCVKLLYPATSGEIRFDGETVDRSDRTAMKCFAQRAQMIFQDPYSSLDPRMTVAEIIAEGMGDPRPPLRRRATRKGGRTARTRRPQPRAREPLPRTSSPAASASGSASPGRSRWARSFWCATSRSRRWTSPFRPR